MVRFTQHGFMALAMIAIGSSLMLAAGSASRTSAGEPRRITPVIAASTAAIESFSPAVTTLTSVDRQIEVRARAVAEPVQMFDGRPLRRVNTLRMRVTAYTPGPESCGASADGITASGRSVYVNGMRLAAADTSLLPFGTILTVPGYNNGQPVQVWDRGGTIKGHRLDVLYSSVSTARKWGVQMLDVDVWEYAD